MANTGKILLVHKIRNFLGKIWNWPYTLRARRDQRKKVTTPYWLGGSFIKQRKFIYEAWLEWPQNLKSLHKGFKQIYNIDGLENTLSQGFVSWNGSSYRNGGQTFQGHSMGEEPLIACAQLAGQLSHPLDVFLQ